MKRRGESLTTLHCVLDGCHPTERHHEKTSRRGSCVIQHSLTKISRKFIFLDAALSGCQFPAFDAKCPRGHGWLRCLVVNALEWSQVGSRQGRDSLQTIGRRPTRVAPATRPFTNLLPLRPPFFPHDLNRQHHNKAQASPIKTVGRAKANEAICVSLLTCAKLRCAHCCMRQCDEDGDDD